MLYCEDFFTSGRMLRFTQLILVILVFKCAGSVYSLEEGSGLNNKDDENAEPSYNIEKAIKNFETVAASAGKRHDDGILPVEDTDLLYESMVETLAEIIEAVKNSNNAHDFLKHKGLDRIVAPNLLDIDDELKTNLLILLKVLFKVTPTATKAVIPTTIVDGLLDIFEKDNLALKAHALDVLYVWLPGNPRVQTRVMKKKGLEPFYQQISKLDTSVIKTMLDLFNKILIEHLEVRIDLQKSKVDAATGIIYQRIGLIERMSTSLVCNGLLNIFETSWTYNTKDNNLIVTIFDLIKNVKQFCLKIFRGKKKAIKLFNALVVYTQDMKNNDYFQLNNINVTDMLSVFEDYLEKVKLTPRDEF